MLSLSYSTGGLRSGRSAPAAQGSAVVESTRRHTHDDFQIAVIHEGAGSLYCRGARHAVVPLSLVVVPPGEAHAGHSTCEAGWSYVLLTAEAALLQDACADLHEQGARRLPDFDQVAVSDPQLFASFCRLCRALRGPAQALERDVLLAEAFGGLLLRHGSAQRTRRAPGREPRAVQRAIDYLEEHSAANVTLDHLAGVACLSKFHFTRVFKAEVGLTPHAYQTQIRVRHAARLIRSGASIASAAYAAGFAAQSHLNLHFKRCLGITPGRYARTAA